MGRTILIFGSLAAAIFILFELNKLSLWGVEGSGDIFIVASGTLFILIGFLISRFLIAPPKKRLRSLPPESNLTKQEYKVLQLMNEGLSNLDIADRLYISESTVKTHVSNILHKFHAKRRTEALKIGRELGIV